MKKYLHFNVHYRTPFVRLHTVCQFFRASIKTKRNLLGRIQEQNATNPGF